MTMALDLANDHTMVFAMNNATSIIVSPPDLPEQGGAEMIALNIVNGIIGVLGLVGNGIVLTVIFTNWKSFQSLTHLLILHQSIIDFASALVFTLLRMDRWQPLLAIPGPVGEIFCRLWHSEYPLWALFMTSTLNLVLLTSERYLAVVHPVLHLNKLSRSKVKMSMATIWIFGFGYQSYLAITTTNIDGKCGLGWKEGTESLQTLVGVLTFLFEYLCPLCIMSVEYILIAFKLRNLDKNRARRRETINLRRDHSSTYNPDRSPMYNASASNHRNTPTSPAGNRNEQEHSQHQDGEFPTSSANQTVIPIVMNRPENKFSRAFRNVIRTLIVVFFVNVVCWTPAEFEYIIYNLGGDINFDSIFHKVSVVLILCNMVCNPFVYSIQYKEFQIGVRRTFCLCIRQNRVDTRQIASSNAHTAT